jgi:hypothetical protein
LLISRRRPDNPLICVHMLQCSFETLEQCKWTSRGRGGDCLRDPFLPATDTLVSAKKPLKCKDSCKAAGRSRINVDEVKQICEASPTAMPSAMR